MKINPGFRPFGKDVRLGDPVAKPVTTKSFADMMQQQDGRSSNEEMQQRLQDIYKQGERLSKSMTVRELRLYKTMVKRFLEDTVRRGVAIRDARGWDRRGRSKRYRLVEEIDTALLELADELLQSEEGKIDMLNKVGEIRGMLINLTF
ncbi:YaaR family protein [Paenibacillus sp. ACRRX]|uniref:YaaR family protein n=1 Tax=Paenibacillus TaxID=44249 RepID=UPI0004209F8E|nr:MULTISPECIES: YaaR family protein [Paenibacillus]MCG7410799.1 YaaR family protein [Paenibacillus sp. ACRRX]MDK8184074.1 YaaR family protein [Paenibacillus sp. UMB4589-SE434]